MIKGIDVSGYDLKMNWSQYDWDFAFIKISEGLSKDSLFDSHWTGAKGYTLRGAYHFMRCAIPYKTAAARTTEYMANDFGELPIALDLERHYLTGWDGLSSAFASQYAKSWLAYYETITGIRPIIYTSPGILFELSKVSDISWMRNYKLWLATYPFDNYTEATRRIAINYALTHNLSYPPTPSQFPKINFWQWTGKGLPELVPGYYLGSDGKKAVDLNFYNGTLEDLQKDFSIVPPITKYEVPICITVK